MSVKALIAYFRANPQVFVLVLVCLILGIGTFFAVVFGLISAGSDTTNGEPSGVVGPLNALIGFLAL